MEVLRYGNPDADKVLIQLTGEHETEFLEKEITIIKENTNVEFQIIAVRVDDWNQDLSPWEAPAVFGKEGFAGGASKTLQEIKRIVEDSTKRYYIGGYSLAGLFSLWAACQMDVFEGVAAASPSIWFPGFIDYMKENRINSNHVYLSLGDKEEKTRNQIMATVGQKLREAYDLLKEQNVDCILEWNQGNHFKDADLRTAKAFSWVLQH